MIRIRLGDAQLGIDDGAMLAWLIRGMPEGLRDGSQLDDRAKTLRLAAKPIARGMCAYAGSIMRKHGAPPEALPKIPKGADPVTYTLDFFLSLFAAFLSSREWIAEHRFTTDGIEITGLAPGASVGHDERVSFLDADGDGAGAVADSGDADGAADRGEPGRSLALAGHVGQRQDDSRARDRAASAPHVARHSALRQRLQGSR